MLGALLYLRVTSFRNWFLARARRLRQPKYFVGAVVGVGYFYVFFFRSFAGVPARHAGNAATEQAMRAMEAANVALAVDWLPATTALGALALLLFTTVMWVVPTQRAALGFSEAEIAFLFPAPISRRGLIHFRLLSSQFRSLAGAAIMMLFSNRWTIVGGNALTHALGWWFIFSALNLHFSGTNFTLTRLTDLGFSAWRRRGLVLLAMVLIFGATVMRLPEEVRLPVTWLGFDLRPITAWIVALSTTAPLGWLLWPLKLVIAPFLAVGVRDFLVALAPALAVITLHYLWVVHSAVAFEDASVAQAEKRSARLAAWRSGRRSFQASSSEGRAAPFHLASVGRPELAFLWKNLLSTWPYFTPRVFLGCAGLILAAGVWLNVRPGLQGVTPVVGGIALMFTAYALVVGPQFARQDIRSDLAHGDVLKTYPLPGWQLILGELLTPVAILTGVLWLALLTIVLIFSPFGALAPWLTVPVWLTAGFGLIVTAPVLATLQLLVPNAAALLFPAWFQVMRTRGGGPEVIGQRMIFFFAQVFTMVVALIPPLLLASAPVSIFVLSGGESALALVSTTLTSFALFLSVLIAEIGLGLWVLGRRFEQLDLSSDVRN
jgi:hypothetical protein